MYRLGEVVGVGAVVLAVYFVMPLDGEIGALLAVLVVVVAIVALVPLSIHRARQILVSQQPVLVAAQSLFLVLTLLIVSFSSVYYLLGTHQPSQINGIATKIDSLYFTVTILATVGFGDITATGQGARALVTANMIVNLVLVAIAVRLLSWALKRRHDSSAPADGADPLSGQ